MKVFLPFFLLLSALLPAGPLQEKIDLESTYIINLEDEIFHTATHLIERGEYYLISDHYKQASHDLLDGLDLLSQCPHEPEAGIWYFRGFVSLGILFANMGLDDQYFATLDHLKTLLESKKCTGCHPHAINRSITPQVTPYAQSSFSQFTLAFFVESLERRAAECVQTQQFWLEATQPLIEKLEEWAGHEEELTREEDTWGIY